MFFFRKYTKIIFINYVLVLLARVLEFIFVYKSHSVKNLLGLEALGFVSDILLLNIILAFFFPFYVLLRRIKVQTANVIFMGISLFFAMGHMLILRYFIYQLEPVGSFLFKYSLQEISFTLNTSGEHYLPLVIMLVLPPLIVLAFLKYRKHIQLPAKPMFAFVLLSVPAYFVLHFAVPLFTNPIVESKPAFFYQESANFFIGRWQDQYFSKAIGKKYQEAFPGKQYISTEYPFLHHADYKDVISPYFNKADSAPNIVLLIVEGLADKFIHPYHGQMFMPFMDSLSKQSLYWDHFLTNGERSFAAVPSLTGSLPYGEIGFTLMEKYPNHFSLVSVLKNNGYHTRFFDGQGSWFHRKDAYFKYNNIDLIFDNSNYAPEYEKIIVGEDKFFWGYNDKILFEQSLKVIDTLPARRQLNIYFTGTTHSPFVISNQEYYEAIFNKFLNQTKNEEDKAFFTAYKKYIITLPFANDALAKFFADYKKRKEYKNTIFIITGDHPMTEIPIENPLKKYHVPLIIFSPLLKHPHTFHSVGSHLDVYEALLAYLHNNYGVKVPNVSSALSNILDTATQFRYTHPIAFMNRNREIIDFLDNGYYIANNEEFYKVDTNFNLQAVEDEKLYTQMLKRLKLFSQASLYASTQDKIVPDSLFYKNIGFQPLWIYKGDKTIATREEYQNILSGQQIENKPFYFEISGDIIKGWEGAVTGVLQINNAKDSAVLWQPFDIDLSKKVFQLHFLIQKLPVADKSFTVKAYFWNKNKENYKFINLKSAIYRKIKP